MTPTRLENLTRHIDNHAKRLQEYRDMADEGARLGVPPGRRFHFFLKEEARGLVGKSLKLVILVLREYVRIRVRGR
jgi:hypothetical protein